ncbi:MAG: hypothetical protein V9F04_00780 [Dermatophilaceae bacterium]|jgi:hypothetical protein
MSLVLLLATLVVVVMHLRMPPLVVGILISMLVLGWELIAVIGALVANSGGPGSKPPSWVATVGMPLLGVVVGAVLVPVRRWFHRRRATAARDGRG